MSNKFGLAMILGQIAAGGGFDPFMNGRLNPDPIDEIDLEAEYKLIQQKKSNLSASQRRRVVYRYEKMKEQDQ